MWFYSERMHRTDTERLEALTSSGGKQGREIESNVWWLQMVTEQL